MELAVSGTHLIARCSFLSLSRTDQIGNTASSRHPGQQAGQSASQKVILKMRQADFEKVTKEYM